MASGCPLITTDADGGNRDQVLHGNTGMLCKSADDFVKHCLTLAKNEPLRLAMGRNAARLIADFTPDRVLADLLRFLS
jgi:glycosyltransferase involved in cell wall biosynthesis